jgi:hypothetical protein
MCVFCMILPLNMCFSIRHSANDFSAEAYCILCQVRTEFYVSLTVHLGIIPVNKQLDAIFDVFIF